MLLALITAVQARQHYPALTGTGEDTTIDTLIARADGLLALHCGYPADDTGVRTLEDTTYTVYLDGPTRADARVIDVGVRPLVSVTSVHVDDEWVYGADALVDSAEYVSDRQGTVHLRKASTVAWTAHPRAIRAVVVAGYASTPPDLVALAAATVWHLWQLRRTQGQVSAQYGGDQVTYSDPTALVPGAVRSQLGPYILWESRAG